MTAARLSFRGAGEADIDLVVELAQSAYRGDASRGGWTTEADFLDGQRIDPAGVRAMLGEGQRIVIAERDGRAVGCCHLLLDHVSAWFGLFAVVPGLQEQGIGDALLAHAEAVAADDLDAVHMKMKVIWLRDSLIAWYRRRGYAQTDEIHPFPYGDARFGLPRRDDLHFIVLTKALVPT